MHSIVLAVTGYSLLLSSFITLAFLLRKGCSKKNKSPFYILSTSDVLSTILTAILLLVNHIEAGIRLSYNRQNDTFNDTSNRTWSFEEKENYQFPFLQLRNVPDPDVTLTCDMKGTFMQYGILLAALTNAFVSLMTLTLQCNLTATCVKRRCTDMMESLTNDIQPKDVKVRQREGKLSEDGQEAAFQQDNIDKLKNFWRGIMKILKFRIASKGNRPAKVFATSHWLVSFIVVAILYLAEYNDMNAIRYTEDIECAFDSNFPMNDFYIFSDVEDDLKIADSIIYTTPMGSKYLEKLSSKIKPSRAEVDEIVLKVQKIVKNALNYTNDSSKNTENNFLASSHSITDYVAANNIMNYIRNNMNNITERVDNTLTGQNVIPNAFSSTNNSADSNRDPQTSSSFHDQSKNSSEVLDVATSGSLSDVHDLDKDDGYRKDAQMNPASTEENQKIANIAVRNKTSISNNHIYNNIMKHIQAAIKNQNRTMMNRHDRAKQPEWNDSNSIRNLFSSKSDDFNSYINREMRNGTRHMINECLLSTKFLQLYLFVLFFAIYFLSILSSCILQIRGKHMCESTGAILRAKIDLPCNSSEDNNTIIIDESPHLSSLDKNNRYHNSTKGSNASQEARKQDISSRSDTEVITKDRRSDREIKNENLLLEIDCAIRIFNATKSSLILCIVLWTPIFLGILFRVLLCIRSPQWLIDTTFLSANSFGIVRNVLNIYIIKIQEICSDAKTKVNRIHPVK